MKRNLKKLFVAFLLLSAPIILSAQPPHPNGGNAPGPGNTPVGGGNPAPISDGFVVLLSLSVAYGAFKLSRMRSAVKTIE
jgi:hypothetical protein